MTQTLPVRLATQADYSQIVEIIRLHEPDTDLTTESIIRADANREARYFRVRLVAEQDGGVVGYATATHYVELFHPQKFGFIIYVHPEYQSQGIGTDLYRGLLETVKPFDPLVLWTDTSESWPKAQQFLLHKGFVETSRAWESVINPQDFDPAPYAQSVAAVLAQGLTVFNWNELASDPQRNHKYWQLEMALSADMPRPDDAEFTKYTYEHFEKHFLQNPNFIPEANLICVAPDGRYVGLNALWKRESDGQLGNGTTGTLPEFKRRGIALALKVQNLIWAKQQGYTHINTFNRSDNLPMWNLNERLGFVRKPAWVNYEKRLRGHRAED